MDRSRGPRGTVSGTEGRIRLESTDNSRHPDDEWLRFLATLVFLRLCMTRQAVAAAFPPRPGLTFRALVTRR